MVGPERERADEDVGWTSNERDGHGLLAALSAGASSSIADLRPTSFVLCQVRSRL